MNPEAPGGTTACAPRHIPAALVVSALALSRSLSSCGTRSPTTFSLQRDDTELVIANMALASGGARSIGNNRNCEEGQRLTIVYGPPPGHVETRVEDAVITSSLAVIRAPVDAEAGSSEESLELLDAAVTFNRPGCIEDTEAAATPRVTLVQGRTEVVGSRFFLDRNADEGVMDGPILLERAADEGGEALTASAESMSFAVGEQRHADGKVEVLSEERVTSGDSLELDEASTAILTGNPARSVKGGDVLEVPPPVLPGLDDVVVLGNVMGDLR